MAGGGFSPEALRHPSRTATIFALFFLVAWFGMTALHHSLDTKAIGIGLVGAPLILVVRQMAALNRAGSWLEGGGP